MTAPSVQHIVMLVPGFPENEQDSTCIPALQQYVLHVSRALPHTRLTVIAFQYPYLRGWYRWHNIPVYACGGRGRGKLQRLLTWTLVWKAFAAVRRKQPVDVIHSFWLNECALLGRWLARIYRTGHLATAMGQDVLPENRYLRLVVRNGLFITAPSEFAAGHFLRAAGRPVDRVIPLGLDTAHFHPPDPPPGRTIDLLGVGALTALKNYGFFLDVVAHLRNQFPNVSAMIIGEGDQHQHLQSRIREEGLEHHVRLAGHLPRAEVIDTMYRSRILLHPSRFESQGYVFLEALQCGLSVVSFRVGYAPDTPRMIACRTEDEMIAAVRGLLEHPVNHPPFMPFRMEQSVHRFIELYHSNSRGAAQ